MGAFAASPNSGGLSFLGAFSSDAEPRIAKVQITLGNTAISPSESATVDVVVTDDFIYGEPVTQLLANGFE